MVMSLSMIDLSRSDPPASGGGAEAVGPLGAATAPTPPSPPSGGRGSGLAEAAVSLTQVGLVGWALIDGSAPMDSSASLVPNQPSGPPGEPRRAERVLAPWGVPMLPSEAARLAREAAEADRRTVGAASEGQGRQPAPGSREATETVPGSLSAHAPSCAAERRSRGPVEPPTEGLSKVPAGLEPPGAQVAGVAPVVLVSRGAAGAAAHEGQADA